MQQNTQLLEDSFLSGESFPGVKDETQENKYPLSEVIWARTSERLKDVLDHQIYSAWIKPLRLLAVNSARNSSVSTFDGSTFDGSTFDGSTFDVGALDAISLESIEVLLLAPNKFSCDHVERNYAPAISDALTAVSGKAVSLLQFRVGEALTLERTVIQPRREPPPRALNATRENPKSQQTLRDDSNLNPKYNFSNFVVGECNQFAHAVAMKVSENPGYAYNPLFLYGGVGLGKTHLANAIGNAARRRRKNTLLISSERFVSELIASLKSNNMAKFKTKFRSVDVLIVDDIQFLIGKERTQEEFFHTFNELYNSHKQIIITSDKVPQELTGLEERLRTRFVSGLAADLQVPDFETRVAILSNKAEAVNLALPEEVSRLLAARIDTNVRELEGALNRLQALSSLRSVPPSVELAEEVLRSVTPDRMRDITPEIIQRAVAGKFNVSLHDLLGKRRTHNIAFARQVAMYLCRRLTTCSYPEIGMLFGGRDHTTVIHAFKVITERMNQDANLRGEIVSLEKRL